MRFLVDRIWPRGIRKDTLHVEDWPKELAPSTELRKWFGHDPKRWTEFKNRYFRELNDQREAVDALLARIKTQSFVTFLFGAKNTEYNNAVALREYLYSVLNA